MKQLSKQIPIRAVDKTEVLKTIQHISDCTKIAEDSLHLIGSITTGNGANDIDIAIDCNYFDPDVIHHYIIMENPDIKSVINRGLGTWSYAFPIEGNSEKGYVQVDLMYVKSIEWAKFSYYSSTLSMYKSAVRNIILSAVATTIDIPGKTFCAYDNNLLIARASFAIDPILGLKMVYQMRNRSKKGDRWLSRMENVTPANIKKAFPGAVFDENYTLIDNPDTVIKMLFGDTVKYILNAEQIMVAIRMSFNKQEQINIFERAQKRLKAVKNKMDIPDLTEYIGTVDAT